MIRRPPRSTRTDTLFPYTTLVRSEGCAAQVLHGQRSPRDAARPAGSTQAVPHVRTVPADRHRSEEHTSELQSLMRISYAVFCLKKKTQIDTVAATISITLALSKLVFLSLSPHPLFELQTCHL